MKQDARNTNSRNLEIVPTDHDGTRAVFTTVQCGEVDIVIGETMLTLDLPAAEEFAQMIRLAVRKATPSEGSSEVTTLTIKKRAPYTKRSKNASDAE